MSHTCTLLYFSVFILNISVILSQSTKLLCARKSMPVQKNCAAIHLGKLWQFLLLPVIHGAAAFQANQCLLILAICSLLAKNHHPQFCEHTLKSSCRDTCAKTRPRWLYGWLTGEWLTSVWQSVHLLPWWWCNCNLGVTSSPICTWGSPSSSTLHGHTPVKWCL